MTGRERAEIWLWQSAESAAAPWHAGPRVLVPAQRDRVTAPDDRVG